VGANRETRLGECSSSLARSRRQEVGDFREHQFVLIWRALFYRLDVQKHPDWCQITEPIFTVFLGGLPPRLASASIGTELRRAADTTTIPPLGNDLTAPTTTFGRRIDPDFCHQTQVVFTFSVAALTFRRAASETFRIEGLSAVSAFNPDADLALPPILRFECGVGIRTDLDA
jgi:hypothetical protein